MARKSRKVSNAEFILQTGDAKQEERWKTGGYARLSSENGGDETDDSIQTQLMLLEDYIMGHSELEFVDTYIDNGYSGTNFKRPDFERMMDDVRKKKINCIVVKDLSRFGRDYIETGYYIETIFPFLGVRLIAINDNFDSIRKDDVESLALPIKNMVNSMYAKDISKKVHSAARAKMKTGVPMSSIAPYGYIYNREEKRYDVDEETDWCVKLIFHWALEGISHKEIARRLELAGVVTVWQRSIELGAKRKAKPDGRWKPDAVKRILEHPVYTGAMVSGRTEKALFAGKPKCTIDRDEWGIIEGTHEPLVSKEDFDVVRERLDDRHSESKERRKNNEAFREERPDDMHGFVFCADCGVQMRFIRKCHGTKKNRNYYRCRGDDREKQCGGHRIPELLLKTLVMDEIYCFVENICDKDRVLSDLCKTQDGKNPLNRANKKAGDAAAAVETIRLKRERLYEDYANGILTVEDYTYMTNAYTEQAVQAGAELEKALNKKHDLEQKLEDFHKRTIDLAAFRKNRAFNREPVEKLVERIEVGKDKNIRVVFKFNDVFEEIMEENTKEGDAL